MKITKSQLKQIVREGTMKQMESETVEEIVDLLIAKKIIWLADPAESGYADALQYLLSVVVPTLQNYVSMDD